MTINLKIIDDQGYETPLNQASGSRYLVAEIGDKTVTSGPIPNDSFQTFGVCVLNFLNDVIKACQ